MIAVGDATPYSYIGDSHAGTIGSRIYEDPATGERIVTRLVSIWRFVAADVLSEDGMIGDGLMQALRRSGAFQSSPTLPPLAGLRPVTTIYDRDLKTEYLGLTASANERPYVLSVGEINNRYVLQRLSEDGMDIALPFEAPGLERLPPYESRQTLRADQIIALLMDEYTPLFRGLRIFSETGLRSLYLHSVPPPTPDDSEALRLYRHPSVAAVRYKLALLTNFIFARVCRDLQVGFIDTWKAVTEGNIVRPEFYLDGLHLNERHSLASVREVHRQFRDLRGARGSEQ